MSIFSRREDQRLLDAGRRYFSTAFPNPDRVGCPGPQTLRDIAFRKADRAHQREFMVHMSRCSPCFNDLGRLREEAKRARRRRGLLVAATAVLVVGLALLGWTERRRFVRPAAVEVATLDLTHRGVLRGPDNGPNKPPLELAAGRLELTILLPAAAEPGTYDLQILKQAGTPLWSGEGQTQIEDHTVVVHVTVDLTSVKPGSYFLAVRRSGWDWIFHPLVIK